MSDKNEQDMQQESVDISMVAEETTVETALQESALEDSPEQPLFHELLENTLLRVPRNIKAMSDEEVHSLRRDNYDLVHFLVHHKLPVIPLFGWDPNTDVQKCKVPCIKGWNKRGAGDTTNEELEKWIKKRPDGNFGLVLGSSVGIIAIDIDGDDGWKIFKSWAGENEITPTVAYQTGSGSGLRLLYVLPEDKRDCPYKKVRQGALGEHVELAIMVDGSQTVLPFSIHPNGNVYDFVEGYSIHDHEMATVPDWIMEILEREQSKSTIRLVQANGSTGRNTVLTCGGMATGLMYDEQGNLAYVKGDVFCNFILNKHRIAKYDEAGNEYRLYTDGFWKPILVGALKKLCFDEFQQIAPLEWASWFESQYFPAMKYMIPMFKANDNADDKVNVPNGMVCVETGNLVPHDENYMSTIRINIPYVEGAHNFPFEKAVSTIMGHDADLIASLQEQMGYLCLSTSTKAECILIWLGNGSNGKSLISKIAIELAGKENVCHLSLQETQGKFGSANLINKVANISTESNFGRGMSLNAEKAKAISSGDPIMAERKGEQSFPFRPFATLLYCVNTLPYTDERNPALYRRTIITPFDMQFCDSPDPSDPMQQQKDRFLYEKIMDAGMPGILNWALEGLKRLQANNYVFTKAEKSEKCLREYQIESDSVTAFIEEPCVVIKEEREEVGRLYSAYKGYCAGEGNTPCTKKKFLSRLRMLMREKHVLLQTQKSNSKTYIWGIRLTPLGNTFCSRWS